MCVWLWPLSQVPTIRFLITYSVQKWEGEGLVHFIRQAKEGRGPQMKERQLLIYCVGVLNVCKAKILPLIQQQLRLE